MKIITLKVVVRDENAKVVSKLFEDSHLAQEGLYTLDAGGISDLTKEELEEVNDELEFFT